MLLSIRKLCERLGNKKETMPKEIVTAPCSMIFCSKIWKILIWARCGFTGMTLCAIRRPQPSTY